MRWKRTWCKAAASLALAWSPLATAAEPWPMQQAPSYWVVPPSPGTPATPAMAPQYAWPQIPVAPVYQPVFFQQQQPGQAAPAPGQAGQTPPAQNQPGQQTPPTQQQTDQQRQQQQQAD